MASSNDASSARDLAASATPVADLDPLSLLAATPAVTGGGNTRELEAAFDSALSLSLGDEGSGAGGSGSGNALVSAVAAHGDDGSDGEDAYFKEQEARKVQAMREWLYCVCVVNFDLELGQTMEYCHPAHTLCQKDETSVCFLSFPDSNSCVKGDTVYMVRFRTQTTNLPPSPYDSSYNKERRFLYGFVFFRQEKDASLARGYFQKSVVVITPHPFIRLFRMLVGKLGPMYFKFGKEILEAACHNVAQWPKPEAGMVMELPLVGTLLEVSIPNFVYSAAAAGSTVPGRGRSGSGSGGAGGGGGGGGGGAGGRFRWLRGRGRGNKKKGATRLGGRASASTGNFVMDRGFQEARSAPTTPQARVHPLLDEDDDDADDGEANGAGVVHVDDGFLVVDHADHIGMMRSPSLGAVMDSVHHQRPGLFQEVNIYSAFRSMVGQLWLLWELVVTGRPVLILSNSPTHTSNAVLSLASIIAPLTYRGDFRPFFSIHDHDFREYSTVGADDEARIPAVILGVTNPFFVKVLQHWPTLISFGNDSATVAGGKLKASAKTNKSKAKMEMGTFSDSFKPQVYTRIRPLIAPDKNVMKQLVTETPHNREAAAHINNEVLRKYFLELTVAFLAPFERYFAFSPLKRHESPFSPLPPLPRFDAQQLSDDVAAMAVSKSDVFCVTNAKERVDLYMRFIKSPNFRPWFEARREQTLVNMQAMYRKARMHANMALLVHGLRDSAVMELIMHVKNVLDTELVSEEVDRKMVDKMREHISQIIQLSPHQASTLSRAVGSYRVNPKRS